jgi:hypothetical protein
VGGGGCTEKDVRLETNKLSILYTVLYICNYLAIQTERQAEKSRTFLLRISRAFAFVFSQILNR